MAGHRRILYVERRARGSRRAFEFAVHQASSRGASLTVAGPPGARLAPLVELASRLGIRVERLYGWDAARPGMAAAHDLVITVGRRSRGFWSEGDAVVRQLLAEIRRPVWILHPAQGPELRVVVAAIDLPSAGLEPSRRVLRAAADLASDGAALRLVHCWCKVGESMLSSRTRGGSPRGAQRAVAAAARGRLEALQELVREEKLGSEAGVVLRREAVVPALREVAWRLEADVVVVGASSSTGLGRRLLGSTAERLVGRVPASVLVVPRPEAARLSPRPARRARSRWAPAYPGQSRVDRRVI